MAAPKNPFPGMNPYLEQRWGDVHAALVTYARDIIQDRLPTDLRARMQERVFIEAAPYPVDDSRHVYPDVHVYERPRSLRADVEAVGDSSIGLVEPLVIHLEMPEVSESYLEITDTRSGGRVVTIIEFLSRSNKQPGPGRELYLQKQAAVRSSSSNLVEVDLLRGGIPTTLARPELVRPEDRTTYHVCVHRAAKPMRLEYYRAPLRSRLPWIRLPLRTEDADLPLDMQEIVNLCYERGRYDDIDYAESLRPPVESSEDAAWIRSIVSAAPRQ